MEQNDGTKEDERETSIQENIMKRYKPNKQIMEVKIKKISKRELET